jgi:hypothetical protein
LMLFHPVVVYSREHHGSSRNERAACAGLPFPLIIGRGAITAARTGQGPGTDENLWAGGHSPTDQRQRLQPNRPTPSTDQPKPADECAEAHQPSEAIEHTEAHQSEQADLGYQQQPQKRDPQARPDPALSPCWPLIFPTRVNHGASGSKFWINTG